MRRKSGNMTDGTGGVRETSAIRPEKEGAAWWRKTAATPLGEACLAGFSRGLLLRMGAVLLLPFAFLVAEPDEPS